ncbi:hypothetical protein LW135_03215 [Helicobacter sp. faydin-H20]|uniref:hypothetical protein n=1 Tax=Helicobacter anatolicus TaxID=2905874 RepID=UPI001E35EC7E|nr:hypothetical protein [Helicobacter anatolicus]MCE3036839.1 hypothetical protein [Helicobacter anatolicus]
MSLMGSLMADDYKKKYSDPSLVLYDSSSETKATEQELKEKIYENKAFYQYSTTFDNNGFPILHFGNSSEK